MQTATQVRVPSVKSGRERNLSSTWINALERVVRQHENGAQTASGHNEWVTDASVCSGRAMTVTTECIVNKNNNIVSREFLWIRRARDYI